MKRIFVTGFILVVSLSCQGWGFYAHKRINYLATFLLPPEMIAFYKKNIAFISEHAVDPDRRRYAVPDEGPRHFIDLDRYGAYPFAGLPRGWKAAVERFGIDSLKAHGIVPWHISVMYYRLTEAFRQKNGPRILKLSAELGHYLADAHVPLHTSSNHNGQKTGQQGIHGFWESRIPELMAEQEWDFFIGPVSYLADIEGYAWTCVLESASMSDSVLILEKELSRRFPADRKYSIEVKSNMLVRQYSDSYTRQYNRLLNNMVERRMRKSVYSIAAYWYTAWVQAGKPDLRIMEAPVFSQSDSLEWAFLNLSWMTRKPAANTCE